MRYARAAFFVTLMAGACAVATPVCADLSSWFWRSDETPKADKAKPNTTDQKKTPAPAKTKSLTGNTPPGVPQNQVAQPQRTPDGKPAMPSMIPATGDNAAYIAFDQGQYLTALKLAEADAESGTASAYTLIGRIHGEGLGVAKDPKFAFQSYARASELGDIPGTFALALMYAQGQGVEKDRHKAAELFEKAARTGHAEANYNLGMLFIKGDGKPENPARGALHLQYAAEQGIAQAQYDLAGLYQSGVGVDANALEAAKWLAKAAAQGMAAAEYEYAVQLLKGFGLTRDEKRIPVLLTSAARKGVAGAQNRLAHLYLEGVLVEKSTTEAIKWSVIAKRNGVEDDDLDKVLAQLPGKERQQGERLASEWIDAAEVMPIY